MEKIITIENCNNILCANVVIKCNELNIKYGPNGTGKSTISEAIYSASQGDVSRLDNLLPYGLDRSEMRPKVEGLLFDKVRVFDERYMDRYLFKGDGFFDDTFQVFLKSDETDRLAHEISDLLYELQNVFSDDESIHKLQLILPQYFMAIKCSDDGKVKKSGGVNEFINGNGAGFEHYHEIDAYKPYYEGREMPKISKWAKWRNDGSSEIVGNICPFCTGKLEEKIKTQNDIIGKVFKNSALSTANAVLEYLKNAVNSGFIVEDNVRILENYIGDSSKSNELLAELQRIAIETKYLQNKIEGICGFRPMNVSREQLDNIEENLENMRIEKRQVSYYSTELVLSMIEKISLKIDILKNSTGKLKGLFIQHEQKLQKLIEDRENDIDEFFAIAGFPYKFRLQKDGENKAIASICPIGNDHIAVGKPKEHLSWGERNAFSLVMFMFEAISDGADLIVLDDPISAFDENKKFAIIRRMFDNQKLSFRDRTVLMLTHDMQPLIDYVHGKFFSHYGLTTKVNAVLIQNSNGTIEEKDVNENDLMNIVQLTESIAKDVNEEVAVRVVNLRKYIELTNGGYKSEPAYEVLSNLIHGRTVPQDKNGNNLDSLLVDEGMEYIKKFLGNITYPTLLGQLGNEHLKSVIEGDSLYGKVIATRLLFEREEGLLAKLRRSAPGACKFINESNHIENDYVIQLDPRKYFSIPDNYLCDLIGFINENIN